MKTTLRLAAATLFLAAVVTAAAQQLRTFTSQYSFGDSLSDNGNLYAITARTQPLSPPYFNGRFSSGPTFAELLGNPLAPAATISAARGNLNFAYGGATAGAGGAVPSLGLQIAQYQLQGLPAKSTDLFTVLAGANDLLPVLSNPATALNPSLINPAGATAAQAVAAGVQSLLGLGAKNIAVLGLPNLGVTPRSLASGSTGVAFGLQASNAFNGELKIRLGALAAGAAADVNLTYVDLQGMLDRVVRDYKLLGFTNATQDYLTVSASGNAGDVNNYVFFDSIHPTGHTHALLAQVVLEELNPEPVLGFAGAEGSAALALDDLASGLIANRIAQLGASNRAVGRAELFSSFGYKDGNRRADGWQPKFEFDASTLAAGIDARVTDDLFAGAAFTGGRINAGIRSGGGDFAVEDRTGRAYGLWRGGPVWLSIDADYGVIYLDDIRRTTALGGLKASGRTAGTHWGAGLRAGWSLDFEGVTVQPWLGLRTERAKLDAYRENDAPSLNFSYDAQTARASTGVAGVAAGTVTQLAGRKVGLNFAADYHGNLGSEKRTLTGRLADNFTRKTAVAVKEGNGDGFNVGGSATWFFAKTWSATLGYTAEIRSHDKLANQGTFSVQSGF